MRESCSLSSGLPSSVWHQRRWVWGGSKHGAQSQLLLGACLCHCCWNIQGPAGGGIYGEPIRVDDKSKGTRGIRKGKRLFSAFSNACRTRLRTKLIHSLNALGVADEVAEPGWGGCCLTRLRLRALMAQQGPEQALGLGQPGMEAQPGDAPRNPKEEFSIKFTHEVFSAFAAQLLVVPQLFGSWDVCRGCHLFLSCFQSQKETVPCVAPGGYPLFKGGSPPRASIAKRIFSGLWGQQRYNLSCVRSSVSSPGSEQATSHQESTRHQTLHSPSSFRDPCGFHIPPAALLPDPPSPVCPRAVILEQSKLRSGF